MIATQTAEQRATVEVERARTPCRLTVRTHFASVIQAALFPPAVCERAPCEFLIDLPRQRDDDIQIFHYAPGRQDSMSVTLPQFIDTSFDIWGAVKTWATALHEEDAHDRG